MNSWNNQQNWNNQNWANQQGGANQQAWANQQGGANQQAWANQQGSANQQAWDSQQNWAPQQNNTNNNQSFDFVGFVKGCLSGLNRFWISMKNRMGIGEPELNETDAYEKDKLIIPDCVKPNENETPIKQFKVATLRNRIIGIPYMKAIGRMQVTNKRVIFRAPGKCLAGRTTLQHEFAIDEIAGVEARREFVFNIWDLLFGFIVMAIGGAITTFITAKLGEMLEDSDYIFTGITSFLFGVAGCIPFFMMKKKWLLKLLCLGGSFMPLYGAGAALSLIGKYNDSGASSFFGGTLKFLSFFSFAFIIFALIIHTIKPNLILLIKTKSANEAIDIKRKKLVLPFFGSGKDEEHTGFAEVIPAEDAERCIREINAMITDVQKLGDFGISKWKEE